jgi:hypothetical protein
MLVGGLAPTIQGAGSRCGGNMKTKADSRTSEQQGFALVLALIFSILIYVLVAELVVSGRMLRMTGENDALLTRMRYQMDYVRNQIEDTLLSDMASAAAGQGGGGAGGLGALGSAGQPGQSGQSGQSGQNGSGGANCDSSRDSWYAPQGFSDGDLTTYAFVEDENRKFNILSLWSPDQEFAKRSRERLVRLLDCLRQDTEYDISSSDAERIVRDLEDWVRRPGSDALPKPKLKSDSTKNPDLTLPLTLDELLMLPSVNEDLFYDKVIDGKVILGLESVLTIWTSLAPDPGDPAKLARQQQNNKQGNNASASPGGKSPPASSPSSGAGNPQANPNDPNAPPVQPQGEGIHININTATRPVLRALFPPEQIPDAVIDAILTYRNTEDEEAEGKDKPTDTTDFGDIQLGDQKKYKIFTALGDLEKVPEFANLPDPQLKADFENLLTVKSDVFSVHLAALYKRNEELRSFVLRRARSILVRVDDGGSGKLVPLILMEERHGLRLKPVDLQENRPDLMPQYMDLDQFAAEERASNPFLVDFYLPKDERNQLLTSHR